MHSRRSFLKRAAMVAGAAGVATGVPEAIQKAFAIDPTPGSTWKDAEHIVILMQENRSFDHALGTLQGVRGFNDPRAIRQANGNSVFLQSDANGNTFAPWRLDIKDTRITWMGSISHARNTQVGAWNHGHHNNWIDQKRSGHADAKSVPMTMGHYTREDIPFYYALADAFTVCDQNYCGVMTSTTPNRSLLWTGTVRSEQSPTSSVYMRNQEFKDLNWTTVPELLQTLGVSWKVYQNEVHTSGFDPDQAAWLGNVGNVLKAFNQFNVNTRGSNSGKSTQQEILAANSRIKYLKESPLGNDVQADREAEVKELEERVAVLQKDLKSGGGDLHKLSDHEQELHMRAFVTNATDDDYHKLETISFESNGKQQSMKVPKGDVLHQFRKDVEQGHLPTVSWLVPPGAFSDHPSHAWFGAWYLSEVVNILTHNPEVWKKTIFIMTYDENDGYFDHSPSYVAADPRNRASGRASEGIDTALEYSYAPDETAQGVSMKDRPTSGPIGLGYRVPMIVASPWSRGGYVNSQLFDQTSTLQFMEKFMEAKYGKKLHVENLSAFRRSILGDMTSVFRPFDEKIPDMPFHDRDKFVEGIQAAKDKAIPTNFKSLSDAEVKAYNANPHSVAGMTKQEPGIRPSNALPYEVYCEGDFNAATGRFGLAMRAGNSVHGARSAGVPFNVYVRNTAKSSGVTAVGNNNENMMVATYAVKAGDTMQEAYTSQVFKDGKYQLHVHAPNGFYREFYGDATAPVLVSRCVYERGLNGLTGNVEARLKNVSTAPVKVAVTDNSYKTGVVTREIQPGQQVSVALDLKKQHGWYDFTVKAEGSNAHVRYAGRVETGKDSFTDPLMGGVLA